MCRVSGYSLEIAEQFLKPATPQMRVFCIIALSLTVTSVSEIAVT